MRTNAHQEVALTGSVGVRESSTWMSTEPSAAPRADGRRPFVRLSADGCRGSGSGDTRALSPTDPIW